MAGGASLYGGSSNCNSPVGEFFFTSGCGTIFKITPAGTLTTLYSFCAQSACSDGFGPDAGLIQATNGDFYGTTYAGGANCTTIGCGTVFSWWTASGPGRRTAR